MLADIYFYRKFVIESFNEYVEAQGLTDMESDSRKVITNDNFFLTGKLKREVIYTENFRTHFVYETSGRRFPVIPIINLVDYKINIEKNPNLYKSVNFYDVDYEGKLRYGEFGNEEKKIYEGQLDKDGNLLTELPWVKNYEYDENGPEVKMFLKEQNSFLKELYENGEVDSLEQFDNLRDLYKSMIKDGINDGSWNYESYLKYVVDAMNYEMEVQEEHRQELLEQESNDEKN